MFLHLHHRGDRDESRLRRMTRRLFSFALSPPPALQHASPTARALLLDSLHSPSQALVDVVANRDDGLDFCTVQHTPGGEAHLPDVRQRAALRRDSGTDVPEVWIIARLSLLLRRTTGTSKVSNMIAFSPKFRVTMAISLVRRTWPSTGTPTPRLPNAPAVRVPGPYVVVFTADYSSAKLVGSSNNASYRNYREPTSHIRGIPEIMVSRILTFMCLGVSLCDGFGAPMGLRGPEEYAKQSPNISKRSSRAAGCVSWSPKVCQIMAVLVPYVQSRCRDAPISAPTSES